MKTTMKKLLSFVLVAVLLVSAIPFQASAAEGDEVYVYIDGAVQIVPINKFPTSVAAMVKWEKLNDPVTFETLSLADIASVMVGNSSIGVDGSISKGEEVYITLVDDEPAPTEKPTEPASTETTSQAITMKLLFNDDTVVSETLTHTPSNGVSSTIANLLKYVYDANWADTYEFVRANNSRLGTITDINAEVKAGESINVRLKTKAQEVKPIDIIVKVDSSDNVVWTGSKVPSNGTSSKVEDLLSYCWNKDWDDVYEFDHAWSHEQQKNVARTGSVNAGDTLYIMVNKLDSSKPTTPSTGTTYTVTFYDVNNAEITSVNVASGSKVHVSNFEDAAKYTNIGSGYTFAGWKVGKNGTTTYTNSKAASLTIGGNTSFYAVATKSNSSTKFPYSVILHIYAKGNVSTPIKTVTLDTWTCVKDGVITLDELKEVVKTYYTSKDSDGIGYDGIYYSTSSTKTDYVNDENKTSRINNLDELRSEGYVHLNVWIDNYKAKTTSNADPSNPKTGDTFTTTMTIMTISASALVLVYFFNKKRAIVK